MDAPLEGEVKIDIYLQKKNNQIEYQYGIVCAEKPWYNCKYSNKENVREPHGVCDENKRLCDRHRR